MLKLEWLVAAVLALLSSAARAENYHPGFNCPRPDDSDQLTTAICGDSGMAQAELILEKSYYLHREADGPTAFPALKAKAAMLDKAVRDACHVPSPGRPGILPNDVRSCYSTQTKKLAAEWASSVYGAPYAEAIRDIDTHIALQRKLVTEGLLDDDKADGVYGEATREAIITWQRSRNLMATGFLSALQARQLLAEAQPVESPKPRDAADRVQALFTRDMLNVSVAYLEAMIGPAIRVARLPSSREARSYRVAGCAVTAYANNREVYGYGIDLNRACRPDLSDILRSAPQVPWPATFGTVEKGFFGGATFQATCLTSCGNGSLPLVLMRYEGPHADEFINLELTVPLATDRTLAASSVWTDAMKPSGGNYIEAGRFNCETRYNAIAERAFADIQFTHLFIGMGQDETADEVDSSCSRK